MTIYAATSIFRMIWWRKYLNCSIGAQLKLKSDDNEAYWGDVLNNDSILSLIRIEVSWHATGSFLSWLWKTLSRFLTSGFGYITCCSQLSIGTELLHRNSKVHWSTTAAPSYHYHNDGEFLGQWFPSLICHSNTNEIKNNN